MPDTDQEKQNTITERQAAVLDCALQLLVDGGEKALTTAAIARSAGCSKESLYKWFGDRDGLLAAIVSRQASKVKAPATFGEELTKTVLRQELIAFAENLLSVISSDISIALNRLAISQASKGDTALGIQLLKRGRGRIGEQTIALLKQAQETGLLQFESAERTYQTLYGLVVKDTHTRLLLGYSARDEETKLSQCASEAIDQFMKLFEL